MNPQVYELALERLFAAGALDAWLTPIQMKKNRPAVQLSALCDPAHLEAALNVLASETTTLGVRVTEVGRYALPREERTVATPYGDIRVKVAMLPGGGEKAHPEYDDVRRAAEAHGVPLRVVLEACGRRA
jgi:hypothetical protein